MRRVRWGRVTASEAPEVERRLARWPQPAIGGHVRHMLALSLLEAQGVEAIRVATHGARWAAAAFVPGKLLVPCGDAELIAQLPPVVRRWRLMVGDEAACRASLASQGRLEGLIVHHQRLMTLDPRRVPADVDLPDPGLRIADVRDLDRLADLAVRLHIDDRFGPNPGVVGWRGYRSRLADNVQRGLVWCVGPVGSPVAKLERSVSSARWGYQLSGIVVDPAARHLRVGRGLVAAAVREILAGQPEAVISLHVRSDNDRAIAAYRAAGFTDCEAWLLALRP